MPSFTPPTDCRLAGLIGYRLERARQNWLHCITPETLHGADAPRGLVEHWQAAAGRIAEYARDEVLADRVNAAAPLSSLANLSSESDPPGTLLITGSPDASTFAAVDWLDQNLRLGQARGQAAFFDQAEWVLFNHVLAGQDHHGRGWAARVDLAGRRRYRQLTEPRDISSYGTRSLSGLPQMVAQSGTDGPWIHLYCAGEYRLPLSSGDRVCLSVDTHYPYAGRTSMIVDPPDRARFTIRLRKPGWARRYAVCVNHLPVEIEPDANGYLALERDWYPGDRLDLDLDLPVQSLTNPDSDHLAIIRGPLVFAADQSYLPAGLDLSALRLAGSPVQLAQATRLIHDEQTETPHLLVPARAAGQELNVELVPFYEAGNRDPNRYRPGIHALDEADTAPPTYQTWLPWTGSA